MNDAAVALSETAASSAVAADVAALINTIDELRRSTARSPKWVDIKDAVALYGVPAKTIKEWARQGWVRQSKLGPTFQSKSLYNASDINSALCRIAAGSAPICALRRED